MALELAEHFVEKKLAILHIFDIAFNMCEQKHFGWDLLNLTDRLEGRNVPMKFKGNISPFTTMSSLRSYAEGCEAIFWNLTKL